MSCNTDDKDILTQNKSSSKELPSFSVRLYPQFCQETLKADKDKEYSLWSVLRAHDSWGQGRLDQSRTVNHLTEEGVYSRRSLYRLLKSGEGIFWGIDPTIKGGAIRMHGLQAVADYFDLPHLSSPQEVPIKKFKTLGKRRAWVYSVGNCKPVDSPAFSNPISRLSIQDKTGIEKRQQTRYEKRVEVKRRAAFMANDHPNPSEPGQSVRRTDQRLGNIYRNRASSCPKGMTRKVNRTLRSCEPLESGEGQHPPFERRYFRTINSFIHCKNKWDVSLLLVPSRGRIIRTRPEWEQVITM